MENEKKMNFFEEVMNFVKEATPNEIKIALIVNTILTIFISFFANTFYQVFKYLSVTWIVILITCTLLLKLTTRDVVKRRHDIMYDWIMDKFGIYLSKLSLTSSILYLTIIISALTIILTQITIYEVLVLITLNSKIILAICLTLKNSWNKKKIIPFLKNYFTNLSIIHHVSTICGSLLIYHAVIYLNIHKFSIIDMIICIFGGYLAMYVVYMTSKFKKIH